MRLYITDMEVIWEVYGTYVGETWDIYGKMPDRPSYYPGCYQVLYMLLCRIQFIIHNL